MPVVVGVETTGEGANMTTEVVGTKDPGAAFGARRYRDQLFGDWGGPATHLAAERERLAALSWEHFSVRQLSATVGGQVSGVDLTASPSDEVIEELRQALVEYKVLFFSDQPLTAAEHVAVAARFGTLKVHPFIPGNPEHPELVRFEKGAEAAGYENQWHHDVTWRAVPSKAAMLHAIEVPAVGGDTLFSDMYAAYDALDEELRERIEDLEAEHDFLRAFGAQVPEDRREEMRQQYPVARHPVVVRHPDSGRRLLYVNRIFTASLVGLESAESDELLRQLCRQAERVEHQVRFTWSDHSVAFWDNLAVQHYASSDYWPERRVMERASIVGSAPRR